MNALIAAVRVETERATHEALRQLLVDRLLLQLFEDRGIQPAVYWLPEAEELRM